MKEERGREKVETSNLTRTKGSFRCIVSIDRFTHFYTAGDTVDFNFIRLTDKMLTYLTPISWS